MALIEKTRVDLAAVSSFLFTEAALLDTRNWSDWLYLFEEGGMYWVPLTKEQTDPINKVSLFYENAMMREVRARRLEEQRAWSQQPVVHSARVVGNVQLLDSDSNDEVRVRSTFILVESRIPHQRILAGSYTHRLVEANGSFLIRQKRVDLIDSEGVHYTLEGFL